MHLLPIVYNGGIELLWALFGALDIETTGITDMLTSWMSNALLVLGVAMLVLFGLLQVMGSNIDPLLPATAALFIGSTAVIDRVGSRKLN